MEAAVDRLIPPDDEGAPGARAAGAADYIDGLLGAFLVDPPRIWAGGPFCGRHGGDPGFESFLALGAVEELAWRTRIEGSQGRPEREFNGPVVGLQERYATGLAALGDDFTVVDADEQDAGWPPIPPSSASSTSTPARGPTATPSTAGTGAPRAGCRSTTPATCSPGGGPTTRWSPVADLDADAVVVGSGPGGSTVADVLTAAGWSVIVLEKGRNHLARPRAAVRPEGRVLERRAQVRPAPLPRARPAGRAAHVPPQRGRRRPALHRGREQPPVDGGRRRHPRRRQAAPLPGGGLPPAERPGPGRRRRARPTGR